MRTRTVARLGLGLIFVVFGLNGFLHFLPAPAPTGAAALFVGGLASASYFFPLLKGIEVLAGLMLLANLRAPLALVMLAPIVVNIVAFHVELAPAGLPIALAILGLELYLAWSYRRVFAPLLEGKAGEPAAAPGRTRPLAA
jgi:uncharacterized membrane protein YphA (DoxX/SURF4 family)